MPKDIPILFFRCILYNKVQHFTKLPNRAALYDYEPPVDCFLAAGQFLKYLGRVSEVHYLSSKPKPFTFREFFGIETGNGFREDCSQGLVYKVLRLGVPQRCGKGSITVVDYGFVFCGLAVFCLPFLRYLKYQDPLVSKIVVLGGLANIFEVFTFYQIFYH